MCLILLSWRQRPDYPLVVAANRDEFHARPTTPAEFWAETPQLLAGRDLVGGGTWFGITRNGRWGAVTNFRDPSELSPAGPSRGHLVRDYLLAEEPPAVWLAQLSASSHRYQGFNLLAGTAGELFFFSNRERIVRPLPPGLYGLSNGPLDHSWPKIEEGKAALAALLAHPGPLAAEELFSVLADRSRPPDRRLPNTGIGLEWERLLSSRFIAGSDYGTRSSTLLLLDFRGETVFIERTFRPAGAGFTDRSYTFRSR